VGSITGERVERERKYRLTDAEVTAIRARAMDEGRWLRGGEEIDVFYDHNGLRLGEAGARLRVRHRPTRGEYELTLKGPRQPGTDDKVRTEITVPSRADPAAIVEALGFRPAGRVVKQRDVYVLSDVEVTLDRIEGLGWFCEIEAREDEIDLAYVAERLGLRPGSLEQRSYADLV